ncbi:hypothetical protein C8R45DRAFT_1077534 [Mycena sanguinolenta]|nr:hypothetical protein C8R45DRAFT_1077534 [Mycena sanguinolenta]
MKLTLLFNPTARVYTLRLLLLGNIVTIVCLLISFSVSVFPQVQLTIAWSIAWSSLTFLHHSLILFPGRMRRLAAVNLALLMIKNGLICDILSIRLFRSESWLFLFGLELLMVLLSALFRCVTILKSEHNFFRQPFDFLGGCKSVRPRYTPLSILLNRSISRPLVRGESAVIIFIRAVVLSCLALGVPAFAFYAILVVPAFSQIYTRSIVIPLNPGIGYPTDNITVFLLGLAGDISNVSGSNIQVNAQLAYSDKSTNCSTMDSSVPGVDLVVQLFIFRALNAADNWRPFELDHTHQTISRMHRRGSDKKRMIHWQRRCTYTQDHRLFWRSQDMPRRSGRLAGIGVENRMYGTAETWTRERTGFGRKEAIRISKAAMLRSRIVRSRDSGSHGWQRVEAVSISVATSAFCKPLWRSGELGLVSVSVRPPEKYINSPPPPSEPILLLPGSNLFGVLTWTERRVIEIPIYLISIQWSILVRRIDQESIQNRLKFDRPRFEVDSLIDLSVQEAHCVRVSLGLHEQPYRDPSRQPNRGCAVTSYTQTQAHLTESGAGRNQGASVSASKQIDRVLFHFDRSTFMWFKSGWDL